MKRFHGKYSSVIILIFIELVTTTSVPSFSIINNNTAAIKFTNNMEHNYHNNKMNYLPVDNHQHLCTREENYTEIVRIPSNRTVRVRSLNWCLEIPPRCSSYRTEIREIVKLENVTRTRTIRFCCEGYSGIVSSNETVCRPICRGGCGRGSCYSPDTCKCDSGYVGQHCTQRCPQDYWGDGCQMKCQCRNNGVCDHRNGNCRCVAGWIGDMCHMPCPSGLYGPMCKMLCECDSQKCNPQTGECMYEKPKTTSLSAIQPNQKSANKIIESTTSNKIELYEYTTNSYFLTVPEDPAILFHAPTLLDSEESHIELSANPEVIHVIDFSQQQLTANPSDVTVTTTKTIKKADFNDTNDINTAILSLLIFTIILSVIFVGFLVIYRQYLKRQINPIENNANCNENDKNQICNNVFVKPLPDLPAFTQNLQKTENIPEFYDCPSNNSAIHVYNYTTTPSPLYTTVGPKHFNRKDSQESHLYDEIRYPSVKSCRV